MTQEQSTTLDNGFGHWLAGFIAGEGSFDIHRVAHKGGTVYGCRLIVGLRLDDAPILTEIAERTGLGNITFRPSRGTSKPCAVWTVSGKADVMELVRIFERFPLRAKKAVDFEIWREAVKDWCSASRGGAGHDWSRLAALRERLRDARKYAA